MGALGVRHQRGHVRVYRHVGGTKAGRAALGGNGVGHGLARVGAHVRDHHLGAFFGHAVCNALANAAPRARYHHHFVFYTHRVVSLG